VNLSYTAFSYTVVPALDNILTDTAPLAVAELFIGYLPKRASLYNNNNNNNNNDRLTAFDPGQPG